jgi:gelsolin
METFVPTPQDESTFGKFHEGDSYVIVKKNEEEYQIHYWHGKEATADEMGCSAFFSVQLSDRLPMKSSHHLEEQSYESEMFMSYFQAGVQYLPGGIDSGFKDKVVDLSPKLYQCKGSRYPRIYSVPCEANSVNEGDVFILDCPREGEDVDDILFYWPGQHCNVSEKMKALEVTDKIRRDEKHCRAEIKYPREDDTIDT